MSETRYEFLDRKAVCELLHISRSTLYERMRDDPTFPRPCSRSRQRLRFKRADVERWLQAQEAAKPESRERSQQELEKLAHAPRAGQKRRRHPTYEGGAPAYQYQPSEINDADYERLRHRLSGTDDRRLPRGGRRPPPVATSVHDMPSEQYVEPRYGTRRFGQRRVPSLGW